MTSHESGSCGKNADHRHLYTAGHQDKNAHAGRDWMISTACLQPWLWLCWTQLEHRLMRTGKLSGTLCPVLSIHPWNRAHSKLCVATSIRDWKTVKWTLASHHDRQNCEQMKKLGDPHVRRFAEALEQYILCGYSLGPAKRRVAIFCIHCFGGFWSCHSGSFAEMILLCFQLHRLVGLLVEQLEVCS